MDYTYEVPKPGTCSEALRGEKSTRNAEVRAFCVSTYSDFQTLFYYVKITSRF